MGSNAVCFKYIALFVFILGSLGDIVSKKRATYGANDPQALTLLTALAGMVFYPLFVAVAFAMKWVKRSQLCLPVWKPACVAILFVLHNACLNTGAGGKAVPGVLVGVLVKGTIPFSMLFNMPKATLGLQYTFGHWLSFLVVLVGAGVTIDMSGLSLTPLVVRSMLMILVSIVPLAAGFTFVEMILKVQHKELFALALWSWICVFQSIASLVLMPLTAWLNDIPLSKMMPDLQQGMECYVTGVTPQGREAWDCEEAAIYWWINVGFGLLANMGMALSTRYGGATLMWFAKAMTVPMAAFFFAQPAIMGKYAVPGTTAEYVGVLITFVGVLLFNSKEPARRAETEGIDDEQLLRTEARA